MPAQPSSPATFPVCTQVALASLLTLTALASPPQPAAHQAAATQPPSLVARLYYGYRHQLDRFAQTLDLLPFADHQTGFVLARLSPSQAADLAQRGFHLEIDADLTEQANRLLQRDQAQQGGIPEFPCYRTVEETLARLHALAASHPNLVSLLDLGDSWEKSNAPGSGGYDLLALRLSNHAAPGPKPCFFLLAEHHARELSTTETALRFAEELIEGYDRDADITWMLDHTEIHVLPLANPDGRKWAEQGYWWRKNTNPTDGCSQFPNYGTDLNRNLGFRWSEIGSSPNPCSEIFRGAQAFSEPENQAIRDHARSLFPDRRGPNDTDAAPPDVAGLFVSLHSFGRLVLFPWGWTSATSPNHAQLQVLGAKFGYFNRYTVQPAHQLYATSGTADEWAYGELGVPAYTFEMGTTFFEPCDSFESTVYPSNRLALLYAVKACRQPYRAPAGPDVHSLIATPATNQAGAPLVLHALIDAGRSYGTPTPLPTSLISAARLTRNQPSWIAASPATDLRPIDDLFDGATETVEAVLDTASWSPGRHTLFVEAQNAEGIWGVPTAVFVWIEPLRLTARAASDRWILEWPGVAGRHYTVLEASEAEGPYTTVASGLPAVLPRTSLARPIAPAGARFYRVLQEP